MKPASDLSHEAEDHRPNPPWPIPEFAKFLRCSERHVWRMIEGGKIRAIRIGRRVYIPHDEAVRVASHGV